MTTWRVADATSDAFKWKYNGLWVLPQSTQLDLRWFAEEGGCRPHVVEAALRHTDGRRMAIDVGAHVGSWTIPLSRAFEMTHAFEPILQNWAALVVNMGRGRSEHATCWLAAVGERAGNCLPTYKVNASMSSDVNPKRRGIIPVMTLDMLTGPVDLVKIDAEGSEPAVLLGAQELLRAWSPTLVLEWKPKRLNEWQPDGEAVAQAVLDRLGYEVVEELEVDRILKRRKA